MAYERGLEVIVELGVGDGHEVSRVGDVEEAVVVVFVVGEVGREVDVVDPDVGGGAGLDADGVAIIGEDFGDGQVADYDVFLFDEKAKADEFCEDVVRGLT